MVERGGHCPGHSLLCSVPDHRRRRHSSATARPGLCHTTVGCDRSEDDSVAFTATSCRSWRPRIGRDRIGSSFQLEDATGILGSTRVEERWIYDCWQDSGFPARIDPGNSGGYQSGGTLFDALMGTSDSTGESAGSFTPVNSCSPPAIELTQGEWMLAVRLQHSSTFKQHLYRVLRGSSISADGEPTYTVYEGEQRSRRSQRLPPTAFTRRRLVP